MAKKPSVPEIDADAYYKVRLKRVVNIGRSKLLPREDHKVRGDVLETILDDVHAYELSKA